MKIKEYGVQGTMGVDEWWASVTYDDVASTEHRSGPHLTKEAAIGTLKDMVTRAGGTFDPSAVITYREIFYP